MNEIYPHGRIQIIEKILDRMLDTIKRYDDLSLLEKEIGEGFQDIKTQLNILKGSYNANTNEENI